MYRSLITLRYAKALFLEAEEHEEAEKILSEVDQITRTLEDHPELKQALKDPVIHTSQKQKILHGVFQDHISDLMLRFIQMVMRNRREGYLENMFRNYRDIFNEKRGIKTVRLTTALKLGEREKEDIKQLIRDAFDARKVDFREDVDHRIMGGFIIQVEDQLLDASVRRQLEMIRKTLFNKDYSKN
ncbi:MAG: ATP synthase F1 subunit delta [Bacteroidales bacterium]|nr:ATP synthase F1 subunit delta [Bacteroidales bacterium]